MRSFIGTRLCKNEIFPKEKVLFYDRKTHKIKLLNPNPSLCGFCAQHPSTCSLCMLDFPKSEVDTCVLCQCGSA